MRMYTAMVDGGATDHARRNQKVLRGPLPHAAPASTATGEIDFCPAANVRVPEVKVRWFDHWLKGIDTGFTAEPPISLFVMGINQWRHENEGLLACTQWTPFHLHRGGRANSLGGDGTLKQDPPGAEKPDHFDYDPDRPLPSIGKNNSTRTWTEKEEVSIILGPMDQRLIERRDDVLVYTSKPLKQELEVTGPLELVLYAAPDTDFTVKLVEVFPNGYAMNISEGILRARYRHDDASRELLERGGLDEFRIRMYPTSHVSRTNHRIGVDVSSSNFPRFSRNLDTGESVATGTRVQIAHQTVPYSGAYPSHTLLPVIPT